MRTHTRIIISGKKSKMTKRLYKNNKILFDFYNLEYSFVINKCFSEIGFSFSKNRKF